MTDKEKHFLAGALVYAVALWAKLPPFLSVFVVAAVKEAYDRISGRGVLEVADFAWTCLGGLVAGALWAEWVR